MTAAEIFSLGGHGHPIARLPLNVHRPEIALGRYFALDELAGATCEDLGIGHDLTFAPAAAAPTWYTGQIATFIIWCSDGAATGATVEITDTEIILVQVAGANPGTFTYDFRAAATDYVGELQVVINAMPGWSTGIAGSAIERCMELENIPATTALGAGETITVNLRRPLITYPRSAYSDLYAAGII